MNKPQGITDPLAPQCGNCAFWDNSVRRDGAGECCGVPPTPVILGMKQAQFSTAVDMHLENIRPVMAANARPCALHKRLPTFELGQPKGPTTKLDA